MRAGSNVVRSDTPHSTMSGGISIGGGGDVASNGGFIAMNVRSEIEYAGAVGTGQSSCENGIVRGVLICAASVHVRSPAGKSGGGTVPQSSTREGI